MSETTSHQSAANLQAARRFKILVLFFTIGPVLIIGAALGWRHLLRVQSDTLLAVRKQAAATVQNDSAAVIQIAAEAERVAGHALQQLAELKAATEDQHLKASIGAEKIDEVLATGPNYEKGVEAIKASALLIEAALENIHHGRIEQIASATNVAADAHENAQRTLTQMKYSAEQCGVLDAIRIKAVAGQQATKRMKELIEKFINPAHMIKATGSVALFVLDEKHQDIPDLALLISIALRSAGLQTNRNIFRQSFVDSPEFGELLRGRIYPVGEFTPASYCDYLLVALAEHGVHKISEPTDMFSATLQLKLSFISSADSSVKYQSKISSSGVGFTPSNAQDNANERIKRELARVAAEMVALTSINEKEFK